jgi:WD40 repeat protein
MTTLGRVHAAVRSNGRSIRAFAVVAVVAFFALAALAPGCKKDKESLILVQMQAVDANAGALTDVTIAVSESTGEQVAAPVFDLSAGIPMTPDSLTYGVYIPAGVTGTLTVNVQARPAVGCNGYVGTKVVKVLGGDSPPVTVIMRPGDACNTTGTAGTGGTTGTGGGFGGSSGGAGGKSNGVCGVTSVGTPPTPVTTAPSLANCTYVDQLGTGVTCDPVADTNNPIIYKTAVSPDGQFMVTSGWAYFTDDVSMKIWTFQNGTPVLCGPELTQSAIGPAYAVFSPDSKYLAVAYRQGYVDLFSLPTLDAVVEIKSAPGTLWGVGFSPDSKTVFTVDYDGVGDGHLYADRLDGTAITSTLLGVDPDALAVSPVGTGSGATLAVSGYIGNVGVYSFNGSAFSTTSIMTTASSAESWGIAFSRDGQLLAAGSSDGLVRFWAAPFTSNATSGTSLSVNGTNAPNDLVFAPGGGFLALAVDQQVDIWNVTTRARVSTHSSVAIPGVTNLPQVVSVAFTATGSALLAGEEYCGKVAFCQ